jgi:hypothetical protein
MGRALLIVCLFMGGCGGCGDDAKVGHLPDAPPPPLDAPPIDAPDVDAAIDAPVDAPMPLPVILTITRNGAPARQVRVYFQNADSSLVASVTTDATGTAQTVMDAGGYVTAINPFTTVIAEVTGGASPDELRTFSGVKPGDHLVLTLNDPPPTLTVPVTVPVASNATRYEIDTPCGSGSVAPGQGSGASPTGPVTLAGCSTTDFLVVVHQNNEGDQRVSAFYHPDVAVADGVPVDFTGPIADTYGDLDLVTFSYPHAPDLGTFTATHYFASTHGLLAVSFPHTVVVADGAGMGAGPEPSVQGVMGIVDTLISRNAPHNVITWGPNTTTYEIDLMNLLLPDMLGPPRYDTTTAQVQWSEEATGATPDLTLTTIQVSRTGDPNRVWRWVLAAPYTKGQVQFPRVPADVKDWTPGPDDQVDINDFANAKIVVTTPSAAGYDAVRARILDIHQIGNNTAFVAGAQGQVVTVGPGLAVERGRRRESTALKATSAPPAPATSRMMSRGHLRRAAR